MNGERIRRLRTAMGLSQSDFGGLLGVTGGTILRWERQDGRYGPEGATLAMLTSFEKAVAEQERQELKKKMAKWLIIGGASFVIYQLLKAAFEPRTQNDKEE